MRVIAFRLTRQLRCRFGGTHAPQRMAQRAEYEIAHVPCVAKTHFVLGGMHVDVDLARIEFEIQHEHRMTAVEQHVPIRLPHCIRNDAIFHRTAVHEEVLLIGLCARMSRQPDPAAQSQTVAHFVDRHTRRSEPGTKQLRDATQAVCFTRREVLNRVAVARFEFDVEASQRKARHDVVQMREFRAFALQELASRWRVVEQIADVDRRAARMCRRANLRFRSFVHIDARTDFRTGGSRADRHFRNRRDTRERLASETERGHAFEIVGDVDLAGGVRTHRELQIVGVNADAVVGHAHTFDAALFDRQHDTASLRVEAVLDQLLHDRGRPLDHLAGGDLVGDERR